jgi:hypothetical protein
MSLASLSEFVTKTSGHKIYPRQYEVRKFLYLAIRQCHTDTYNSLDRKHTGYASKLYAIYFDITDIRYQAQSSRVS